MKINFIKNIFKLKKNRNSNTTPFQSLQQRLADMEYLTDQLREICFELAFHHHSRIDQSISIDEILNKARSPVIVFNTNNMESYGLGYLHLLFPSGNLSSGYFNDIREQADLYLLWGQFRTNARMHAIARSLANGIPIGFADEGFVKSILPQVAKGEMKYKSCYSFVFDDLTTYYDSTRASRLEKMLNSDIQLTDEEVAFAKLAKSKLLENYISKYNHQPIFLPNIPSGSVLVVGQAFGDWSIRKGGGHYNIFIKMIEDALDENPDQIVYFKVHPDMLRDSGRGGNKSRIDFYQSSRLVYIDYEINPIALLERFEKVYVCTSQLGFESLLLGKDVFVYGFPFYAGWGITNDRSASVNLSRRGRRRSSLEIFHFAYISYSRYVSPKTLRECSIINLIDVLVDLRAEYFHKNGIYFDPEMRAVL